MVNNVDPDQMLHSVTSELGLLYFLRSVGPNAKGENGIHLSRFSLRCPLPESLGPVDQILVILS